MCNCNALNFFIMNARSYAAIGECVFAFNGDGQRPICESDDPNGGQR